VILYRQQDGRFVPQVLDPVAETLSIGILDLDGDGRPEIWVANDFALRDQIWRFDNTGWVNTEPFPQTSHSTMSLDWGDITGRGDLALFSTDMNPYDISPANLAKWLSVIDEMDRPHERDDPQIMANVLLLPSRWGGWRNQATRHGVDASGWSWAGRLGDLDGDGALDLYVVNGMIASDLFGYLPTGELVEENQAFRNRGDGVFEPAPAWNLGSTASGRGMIMADLDDDGDLDIVVNNLRGRAQLFENRLCGGPSLQVEMRWPGTQNSHAIGAQVYLVTDTGAQWRDVRASGGYLSGDPARVHFGFATDAHLVALEIVWPDGVRSRVDAPPAQTRITLTRQETTP
jgi:enediyne biosynthesis protein E4